MQTKLCDGSVMVCGTLPRDAEYRTVGDKSSSLTTFGVKVGERPSPDVDKRADAIWCNCKCWHDVARAAMHLKKGDAVLCVGKVEVCDYTDKNGNSAKAKNLVCEFVIPMASAAAAVQAQASASDTLGDLSDFEEVLSGSDDPF